MPASVRGSTMSSSSRCWSLPKRPRTYPAYPRQPRLSRPVSAPSTPRPTRRAPPQVIIKLSSKILKVAILKQRKNLPKPADKEKRYILVEDLTPASHKMLTAISKSKLVEKVWTIDGVIKYTVEGQQGTQTVKSVFDPISKLFKK